MLVPTKLGGTLPPEIYMFGSSLTFLNLGKTRTNSKEQYLPRYGEMVRLQTLVFFFNGLTRNYSIGTRPADKSWSTSPSGNKGSRYYAKRDLRFDTAQPENSYFGLQREQSCCLSARVVRSVI
jgi:hypothetical protein